MLSKFIYPLTIILLPLLFLPITPNIFTTPKQIFLVIAVLLLIINYIYQTLTTRTLHTSSSPLKFGLLAFIVVLILNLSAYPIGRLESVVGPLSVYFFLSIWAYFVSLAPAHTTHKLIVPAFLTSTGVLALHTILQLTIMNKLTFLPLYLQSRAFTLTGSSLTTFILIAIGTALSLYLAITLNSSKQKEKNILTFLTMIQAVALIVLGYFLLPGHELAPIILPLTASWNVALDAMKTIKTFALGVGLSNFPNFYKSVKPLFLNSTVFWNTNPANSGSELLQILTTTGVLGLVSFLSLPFLAFKNHESYKEDKSFFILAALSGLSLVFTPGSIPVLFIFFTAIGVLATNSTHAKTLSRTTSLVVAGSLILIVGYLAYQTFTVAVAEISMRRAQLALSQNDGKTVYEQNLKAINYLPKMYSYHLSYSQVNLSLAAALSQKESLSEAERTNIAQLVAQGIQEGKLAISLRTNDSEAWRNLGSLYRNLVNVAEGSDQFALTAYAQAVSLDPGNPALRVEFGGLLYQLGQNTKKSEDTAALFNRAQTEFQTAISLKADYANAYYNLAKLLETAKDYNNAYLTMQKAISLLGPDNADLPLATSELETIKTKLPKSTTPPAAKPSELKSETLSSPSPLPSELPGGPIDIPSEIAPTP